MVEIRTITAFLESLAPTTGAEDWDNVGLLVGQDHHQTRAVLTCLTLTPDVAAEAIDQGAGLIVTHHPVLFRPVQRLTGQTAEGQMLLELIAAGVAVYSPHTGYDNAPAGINQQLAELLDLREIGVLRPRDDPTEPSQPGAGRRGTLPAPMNLGAVNQRLKSRLGLERLQFVGSETTPVQHIAIACGSAAEFLDEAEQQGCQALITGEARFHACLAARQRNVALVLLGHYASERFAMEHLADRLQNEFPKLTVWASRSERNPLQWS